MIASIPVSFRYVVSSVVLANGRIDLTSSGQFVGAELFIGNGCVYKFDAPDSFSEVADALSKLLQACKDAKKQRLATPPLKHGDVFFDDSLQLRGALDTLLEMDLQWKLEGSRLLTYRYFAHRERDWQSKKRTVGEMRTIKP